MSAYPAGTASALRLNPPVVWAYSEGSVQWSEPSQKWDAIALFKGRSRQRWTWCQGTQAWKVEFEEPAEYSVEYRRDAGYFTEGKLYASLTFNIESPILEYSLPRQVQLGEQVKAQWRLAAAVGSSYSVLLQVKSQDGAEVTIQSAELLARTNQDSLTGEATFAVPRAPGEFTACIRGSGSSDSVLERRSFQVTVPEHIRQQTFVQAIVGDSPTKALVLAPDARLDVEWSCPHATAGDAVCIVKGRNPGRVVLNPLKKQDASHTSGRASFSAPREPGEYSICLCAGYRGGQALLVVSHSHLFVSELAAMPLGVVQNTPAPAAPPGQGVQALPEPDEACSSRPQCIICLSADVNAMVEPCGHAQFCESCLQLHRSQRSNCPVCRERVTGHKKIYLP
eukprot:TRINITY_DN28767_c0_g1_i1.p1 TRINITY_DN28767_c0_g1~~TRINITY_DN28767_c0_g1_i1.p1  ORF type:complete len:395 (+),score=46.34 TRINITY_DN28767_c0_g1_i1:131-1315(+)